MDPRLESICKAQHLPEFQPWQIEGIMTRHKSNVFEVGRKGGKSIMLEARNAFRLMYDDIPNHAADFNGGLCYLTVADREAKSMVRGVWSILHAHGWRPCEAREDRSEESKLAFVTTSEIWMPNDNRMIALPTGRDGKNVRPYTLAELQYDEADFMPQEVFDSTGPCLAALDGIRMLTSTPNPADDKDTYFARAVFGKDDSWRRWHIPTPRANPTIKPAFFEEEIKRLGKRVFEREYMLKWSSNANRIFPWELIVRATQEFDRDELWTDSEVQTLGVDFARLGADKTAIVVAFMKGGKCYLDAQEFSKVYLTETEAIILKIMEAHNSIAWCITDDQGVGAGPTDGLVEKLGAWRVMGVANQRRSDDYGEGRKKLFTKSQLYINFRRMLEEDKIVLQADPRIKKSLADMHWSYTKGGELSVSGINNHIAEAAVRAVFPVWNGMLWTGDIPTSFVVESVKHLDRFY
jgi:hypothetical protein